MSENVNTLEMDFDGVTSVLTEIEEMYTALKEKIENVSQEKEKISGYWTGQEATNFCDKFDTVTKYFDSFCAYYDDFILLLGEIEKVYEDANTRFINALKSYNTKG